MKLKLYQLEKSLKLLLASFVFALSVGVAIGLAFLYYTTNYTPEGTITRFNGSQTVDEFEIPEQYPKPVSELLITTHNHIIGFSLIFISLGIIFYFNSIIAGWWKMFFMIEPFVSTVISFGAIWGIRYIDPAFVYVTVISAVLIYISYGVMAGVTLYELLFKKDTAQ